jgi:succinate-semialdehyde dehydrogenase
MSMDVQSIASRLNSSGILRTQGLIGGKWVDAYDGKTIKVNNPATGEIIAEVPCMGKRETNDAIASAYLTYNSWSKLTAQERSKCLRKWYDLLMENKEALGQLITLEQGKPLKEAIGEIAYGASFIEFYAEEAKRIYGDVIPATLSDRRLVVLKQPIGVVGAITPWNFPLAMITRKAGPALACGCTVVIKPSELTPLTALAAAELAHQAGIPPGAINVVMGNAPEIGDALLASSQVRKITFTGSTAVGKKLMEGAAQTVKKVSLELGGNAPCIVFDDADLDVAVKGTLGAKFRNSGQTCVCANRVLVQEGIYPKFVEAFTKAVRNLQVGDGFGEGVTQGPLINEAAVLKVESFLEDAVSKGAKVLLGGKRHSLGMTFYEPTVLGDVKKDMLVSRQEVFGPVAPLLPFKTEEEAIFLANDTNAGLAAYMFTNNVQRSWRVSEALEYGLVGVNEGIISTEVAPFGGVKESGLGREGSKYGMDEYLEVKFVCFGDMNRK